MSHARNTPAVIVNPVAADGKTERRWRTLEPALRKRAGDFPVFWTERPGHATDLAADALRAGHDRIVSVGGDGTHYEVLNGFFEGGRLLNPDAALAILAEGTGSDLARSLDIRGGAAGLEAVVRDRTARVDVGRVTYRGHEGRDHTAHFVNVMHLGMGGAVVARVNGTTKAFGGGASFLWGVTRALMSYENTRVHLELDSDTLEMRCNNIIVANGRYDGGGMLVAPEARMDSGAFDVYVIGDVGRFEALRNLWRLYRGALRQRPDLVRRYRTTHIRAESPEATLLCIEGEQPGGLPVDIQMMPSALTVVVGPHPPAL